MNDLQTYIKKFLVSGDFANNLDDMNNIHLNVNENINLNGSDIFMSVNLLENKYDTSKITNLYDVNINTTNISNNNEVVTINDQLQDSYNNVIAENQALKDSLADMVNIIESNPAQAEVMASKDTIINLRIKLGEGKSPEDFESVFPYSPIA